MPVGSIIAWPFNFLPSNGFWLECNGQYVNPSLYPELGALTAYTPDYRGVFLRGFGAVTSGHYGIVTHYSAGLGDLQGDSIRNITGTFAAKAHSFNIGINSTGAFYDLDYGAGSSGSGGLQPHAWGFDASRTVPVSNEIRPINKSVRWLIKAK